MEHVIQTTSWQQHIERWETSGLTQRGYCQEYHLKPHQFSYWKRKLQKPMSTIVDDDTGGGDPGFIRIDLASPSFNTSALQVQCPDGTQLHGINADNVELVTQLIRGLR